MCYRIGSTRIEKLMELLFVLRKRKGCLFSCWVSTKSLIANWNNVDDIKRAYHGEVSGADPTTGLLSANVVNIKANNRDINKHSENRLNHLTLWRRVSEWLEFECIVYYFVESWTSILQAWHLLWKSLSFQPWRHSCRVLIYVETERDHRHQE